MIASTKKRPTRQKKANRSLPASIPCRQPTVKFTPYAWSKLRYLRDLGPTEVGAFGIASAEDLLKIEDVRLVRQSCTCAYVEFDDESVADFFDEQVDAGRKPEQFARIWIHTHPGSSPLPSQTDEETFERCFGKVDWALMFILSREGKSYSRLRVNFGPTIQQPIRCEIDFDACYAGSDHAAWEDEYHSHVQPLDGFRDLADWWGELSERHPLSYASDYPLRSTNAWEPTSE